MKTLLVALLILVVGTGTAYAECAWVLWAIRAQSDIDAPIGNPVVYMNPSAWTPLEAFPRQNTCEERQSKFESDQWAFVKKSIEKASKHDLLPGNSATRRVRIWA